MNPVPSVDDIIQTCLRLDARKAREYSDGNMLSLCSTPVYEQVRQEGTVINLAKRDGRYAAAYVRVSTENQKADGFSEEDQLRRLMQHFIRLGHAFRVFNDSGIGGGVPFRSPEMMKQIWSKKARTYRTIYKAVFLADEKLAAFRSSMETYLASRVDEIEAGAVLPGVDEDFSGLDADGKPKARTRARKQAQFRPALSLILENLGLIHSIAVTDTTRLSRSEAMTWEIARQLEVHETEFTALMEPVSIRDSEDFGEMLTSRVLTLVAEYKLREAVLGSLRGIYTLLQQGKPFGKIPTWLRRNQETGKAEIATDENGNELPQVKAVRRLIDLYLHESDYGEGSFHSVSVALAREYPSPYERVWAPATVKHILQNPALVGIQREFGIDFPIFPPLIDRNTWEKIKAKIERRGQGYDRTNTKNPEGYLLTGLVKCRCGRLMQHKKKQNGSRQYRCSATTSMRNSNRTINHASVNTEELHRFFEELMATWSGPVVRLFQDSQDGERLQEQITELEAQLVSLKHRREAEGPQRREEATEKVKAGFGNINLRDEAVQAMIEQGVAMLQQPLLQEERETESALKSKQQELRSLLRGDQLDQLKNRISDWAELNTNEKNFVLRRLFEAIQVEGEPPNESLRVCLRLPNPPDLPGIPMPSKRYGNYRRHLPPVSEWVELWPMGSGQRGWRNLRALSQAAARGDEGARFQLRLVSEHSADYGDEHPDVETEAHEEYQSTSAG